MRITDNPRIFINLSRRLAVFFYLGLALCVAHAALAQEQRFYEADIVDLTNTLLTDIQDDALVLNLRYVPLDATQEKLDAFKKDFFAISGPLPKSKIHTRRLDEWQINQVFLDYKKNAATAYLQVNFSSEDKAYISSKKLSFKMTADQWFLILE